LIKPAVRAAINVQTALKLAKSAKVAPASSPLVALATALVVAMETLVSRAYWTMPVDLAGRHATTVAKTLRSARAAFVKWLVARKTVLAAVRAPYVAVALSTRAAAPLAMLARTVRTPAKSATPIFARAPRQGSVRRTIRPVAQGSILRFRRVAMFALRRTCRMHRLLARLDQTARPVFPTSTFWCRRAQTATFAFRTSAFRLMIGAASMPALRRS
jgi:hypothetical protein